MSDQQNQFNKKWWEDRFQTGWQAHESQNHLISRDFLVCLTKQPLMAEVFQNGHSIVEIGCGTGELIAYLQTKYQYKRALGLDFCQNAVWKARELHPIPNLIYEVHDAAIPLEEHFDIAITSNTLEHFKDPHKIIKTVLAYSTHMFVIVPWKQTNLDPWKGEGGPLHVTSFDLCSFAKDYITIDHFAFTTAGWNGSPGQLAVLITSK